MTALLSCVSTLARAEVRLHAHPAVHPDSVLALGMDQLTLAHPNIQWHSVAVNAGWFSPTGYYWIPDASGHTSSAETHDDPGCRPRAPVGRQSGGVAAYGP